MGLFMFAFYITITSIGQEGSAFLNLRMIPLNKKEVIRAKLSTALIPSTLAMIAVTVLMQIMIQFRPESLIALAVTLFAAVFECAFVGVALGCRYPDFTEVPRARFIDQKGVWLGMIIIAASICVTFLPLFLYGFSILDFPVIIAAVPAAVAGILICYLSYSSSLNSLQSLVTQN
jgi:hypothetical protein